MGQMFTAYEFYGKITMQFIFTIKGCVHLKERTCTKNIFIHKFTVTFFRVEKQTIWARYNLVH